MSDSNTQLSEEALERFSRHLAIPGFGEAQQVRLRDASVLIVGLGGLGCPVSLYVAASGVGKLGVADFDRVEVHNLQRQVLFSAADEGKLKVEVAAERLVQWYPGLTVEVHAEGIHAANVAEIISKYDVIVDGTDNFGTRYLLNDACFLQGKALVSGSVFQLEGQVWVLDPERGGPCYRCIFPEPPALGTIPSCNEAGVIGATCGVVGSVQAMEVIKLISGVGKPMVGKLLKFDGFANRTSSITIEKDTACALCGKDSTIRDLSSQHYVIPCGFAETEKRKDTVVQELGMEIDVESAKKLAEEQNALFLDIREMDEAQICQIEGSRFIPMGEIPNHVESLPKDRPIIAYCHHGFRSLRVVMYLRNMGLGNCTSMRGGINHWATVCDPSMARY